MDIARLLKLQDSILANATAMLKDGGDPATVLAQPQALSDARVARITARIAALEAEKASQMSLLDAEITSLKRELDSGSGLLETARAAAEPSLKAARGKKSRGSVKYQT